jgi:hypothetical protein
MLISKVKLKNCVESKLTNHNNFMNNNERGDAATW